MDDLDKLAEQLQIASNSFEAVIAENKRLNAEIELLRGEIQWAVNVLLEKIAAKFEANDTWDIWKSDAAALVRSFKHDLTALNIHKREGEI